MNIESFWEANKLLRIELFNKHKFGVNREWYSVIRKSVSSFGDLVYTYPTDIATATGKNAIWSIVGCTRKPDNGSYTSPDGVQRLKPEKYTNKLWSNDRYTSYRNSADNKLRAILPGYIDFNLMENGFALYEAAHVLAHMWADPVAQRYKVKYRPYLYQQYFNKAVCAIALNDVYNIPVYIKPATFDKEWYVPSAVNMLTNVFTGSYDPVFTISFKELDNRKLYDSILGCCFFIVYRQSQPTRKDIRSGNYNIIYSLGPSKVLYVGWELLDFIYNATPVHTGKRNLECVGILPDDLYDPVDFINYVGLVFRDSDNFMDISKWVLTEDYAMWYSKTPPLPCRLCNDINKRVENVSLLLDQERINDYAAYVNNMFKAVRRAIISYEMTITKKTKKQMYSYRSSRTSAWKEKLVSLRQQYKMDKYLTI